MRSNSVRSRSVWGAISYDEAIRNADSANELRLNIKLNSTRESPTLSLEAEAAPPQAAA